MADPFSRAVPDPVIASTAAPVTLPSAGISPTERAEKILSDIGGAFGNGAGSTATPTTPTSLATPVTSVGNFSVTRAPTFEGAPIDRSAESNLKSLNKKWAKLASKGLDPAAMQAVQRLDLKRVVAGQAALNDEDTDLALQAATNKQVVTPTPERDPWNILGNAVDDITTIGKSIPRIPAAIVDEIGALSDLPAELANADTLSEITRLPGVRMLPGAYTLGNVADGTTGLKEAVSHPVMTALDVLPFASKAAAASKAGEAAVAAGKSPITGVANATIERSPLLTAGKTALSESNVGQALQRMFGGIEREAGSMHAQHSEALRRAIFDDPAFAPENLKIDALPRIHDAVSLMADGANRQLSEYGVTVERGVELADIMQREPKLIQTLPANEIAYVDEIRNLGNEFSAWHVADGMLDNYKGEYVDVTTGKKLRAGVESAEQKAARFTEDWQSRIAKLVADPYADPRLGEIYNTMFGDGVDATDLTRFQKANADLKALYTSRTRLGQANNVGAGLLDETGEVAGKGNIALSSTEKLRTELGTLDRYIKRAANREKTLAPARFSEVIDREVASKVQAKALEMHGEIGVNGLTAEEIALAVSERRYQDVLPPQQVRRIQRGVRGTWQELRAAGEDPVFVHQVSPSAASAIAHPKVLPEIRSISAVKARTWDTGHGVQDASIAVSHQGMEILRAIQERALVEGVEGKWGKTLGAIRGDLLETARQLHDADPRLTVGAHLTELVQRDWEAFTPTEPFASKTVRFTGMEDPNAVLIPKRVARAFNDMRKPPSELAMALGSATKPFRVAVLQLSPRWHINNIAGGAMLATVEDPAMWAKLGDAHKMIQAVRDGTPVNMPELLRNSLGGTERYVVDLSFRQGKTMGRWWNQYLNSHPGFGGAVKAGADIVERSTKFNAFWDDTYRAMAFMRGEEKALLGGMSKEAAEKAGLELANKVMVQWDALTPFESHVMKSVMPFYSFTRHMLKIAYKYPLDHPLRASVTAAIARREVEESGGLPASFLDTFFFGEGEDGMAFKVGALSPFNDIGNMFTLAGFVSSMSPVLSVAAGQVGLDGRSGEAELFPQVHYDAQTGGLKLVPANDGAMGVVGQFLPQAQLIAMFSGQSRAWQERLRKDPESAMREVAGAGGVPAFLKTGDVREMYANVEARRARAQRDAFNEAVRTGDDSYARTFEGNRDDLEMLREAQRAGTVPGQLQVGGTGGVSGKLQEWFGQGRG